MVSATQPIRGPMPHTPEWDAMRLTSFGASEAAAVCGLSKYDQPLNIYRRKIGEEVVEQNDFMRFGHYWEPVGVKMYEHFKKVPVIAPQPAFIHPEHSFIHATPDGLMPTLDDRPLDVKTTSWRRAGDFGEEGSDELPDEYVLQAHQQMLVMGTDKADMIVLLDCQNVKTFTVNRNDALVEMLVEAITELRQRIINRDPPEPHWEHPRTFDLVRSMHGLVEGKIIDVPAEAAAAWETSERLAAEIKALEEQQEFYKAKAIHALGDAAVGVLPGGQRELRRYQKSRTNLSLGKLPPGLQTSVAPYTTLSTWTEVRAAKHNAKKGS